MAETGFPQEKGPNALLATSDIVNPFGGNSPLDLTRLISAAQATTLAINNLNSSLVAMDTVLGRIKDAIIAANSVPSTAISWVSPPFNSTAPGAPGAIAYDASFFYVCVGFNDWRQVALTAF